MNSKKEILNYSSILPEKNKKEAKRDSVHEPLMYQGGLRRQKRIRVGRGRSAGRGKTCGRGQKGQKARTGYSRKAGFEGGQMPLHRRLPKRGFTNIFKKQFQLVNIQLIEKAGLGDQINPVLLKKNGLIKSALKPVKILGQGDLSRALKIEADNFSGQARQKIEAAGGTCTLRHIKPQAKTAAEK